MIGQRMPALSQIPVAAAAWLHRLRRAGHRRALEAFYAQHLAELTSCSAERVGFHLYHLERYWWRCLGFLDGFKPTSASFLAADWVLTILVASDAATLDIDRYAAEHNQPELREAWTRYAASLIRARRGIPSIARGLQDAAAQFSHVRELGAGVMFEPTAFATFDQRQN